MVIIAVFYAGDGAYVAHWFSERSGFDYAISAGLLHVIHLLLLYAFVSMGHGSLMDMGRWVTPQAKLWLRARNLPEDYKSAERNLPKKLFYSRKQFPTTSIIGVEDMKWPFRRKWIHNFIGMWIIGMFRHSPALLFLGSLSTTEAIVYMAASVLHPIVYEIAYWISRIYGGDKHKIFYAELLAGAYMAGIFYAVAA